MSDKSHLLRPAPKVLQLPEDVADEVSSRAKALVPAVYENVDHSDHGLVLHVMVTAAERPLCRCKAPERFPVLHGLTQEENADLMVADREARPWKRLMWCNVCTSAARLLTNKHLPSAVPQ